MRRVWKQFVLPLIMMYVVTIVTLLVLSILSYLCKWQADTIMAGIIGTYIVSGVSGGIILYFFTDGMEVQYFYTKGMILGNTYMIVLLILSAVSNFASGWDILLICVIWLLVVASTLLGSFLTHAICKKR